MGMRRERNDYLIDAAPGLLDACQEALEAFRLMAAGKQARRPLGVYCRLLEEVIAEAVGPFGDSEEMLNLSDLIREEKADAEVIPLPVQTPTVERAAEALGVTADRIIKSLVFQARDGECVLVIAAGTARVDPKKLTAVTGKDRWRLAPPDVVQAVTGYPAGGTPPVGHATKLGVLMDAKAAALDVVYGGGGALDAMLRIRIADIRRLSGAEVHDLT